MNGIVAPSTVKVSDFAMECQHRMVNHFDTSRIRLSGTLKKLIFRSGQATLPEGELYLIMLQWNWN